MRWGVGSSLIACIRRLARSGLPALLRSHAGTTSVEFALIAGPFIALTFAILEIAFIFFANQALENAAASAGRMIMTGQTQQNYQGGGSAMTPTQFKTAACNAMAGLFSCASNLIIDVQTYSSFANANTSNATSLPVNNQGVLQIDPNNPNFNMGGPSDIIVVRLMYQWPGWVTLPGLTSLMNVAGGGSSLTKRLIMATAVFRNEPFP
jgi:Flp pilus assembly protein TadG